MRKTEIMAQKNIQNFFEEALKKVIYDSRVRINSISLKFYKNLLVLA